MKLAVCQFRPDFAAASENTARIAELIRSTEADLIVFPEAAITGYCFSSKEEAQSASITADSAEMDLLKTTCAETHRYAIIGFAENLNGELYNSASFIGPSGVIATYRKVHLPFLGLDRYVTPGNDLAVHDTLFGRIGILICFDIRLPEAARVLTLKGADLICLPTNWPDAANLSSDIICPARCMENHVFLAAANRVGEENGYHFVGRSKIINPMGQVIAALDDDLEGTAVATVDLEEARAKRVVRQAGEYELDLLGERKPELYASLSQRS